MGVIQNSVKMMIKATLKTTLEPII